MANWLKQLKLNAIALVDRGANQDAHVTLAKRDDSEVPMKKAEYASMEECMAAEKDESKCKQMMAAMKRAGGDGMADKELAEQVAKAAAEVADLKKRLDASEVEAKAAKDRVAKMEDEAQAKVFLAKAEGLSHLPGAKPAEFGPLLRKMYGALTADEQKAVDQVLTGADNSLAASLLLQEVGKGGDGIAREPYDKLEQLAKAYLKDHPDEKLTVAQAMAKVEATPEGRALYKRYDDEQQKAARGR